jgi:hypothetical protein
MITDLSAAFCAALLALTPVSHALRVESLRTQQVAHVSSENDQDAAVTAATFDALRVSHRRLMVRFHSEIVLQMHVPSAKRVVPLCSTSKAG